MEYVIGIVIGVLLTLLVLGVSIVLLLRRSANEPLPEMPQFAGEPSVMVMLIEPFLNQQLSEAMAAQADVESSQAEQKNARVKIKLLSATLDVQTGQRAKFYALLSATMWNFTVPLSPVTDLFFGLQAGRVKIFVTNVQLAGFNVPRVLVDRIVSQVVATAEAKLNNSLVQLERDTRVQLFSIETTEDLLILKFAGPASSGAAATAGEGK